MSQVPWPNTHRPEVSAQDPPPQPCLRAAAEGRPATAIILLWALPDWDPAAAGGELRRATARVRGWGLGEPPQTCLLDLL
jgi:hypothetical protein